MAKILDVFDYLNVADKEDVYTSLIHYAFLESDRFRARFCAFFGAKEDPHAKLLLRNPFYFETLIPQRKISKDNKIIEAPHRHQRQIPDLTLVTQDKICIIESKLFSKEGSFQTERYGNIQFLESIKHHKKLASLHLDDVLLSPVLSDSLDKQCLFYMTIDGEKAMNPNFLSISWSDLFKAVFIDCDQQNEILQPILKQMAHRFIIYPQIKSEIIALRQQQGIDTFLRNSSKHFLLSKESLFIAYFDDFKKIKELRNPKDTFQIELTSIGGVQQISLGCSQWKFESLEEVLAHHQLNESVETFLEEIKKEAYPFTQLKIKIVNNKKVTVSINYEFNPYLSEINLTKKYGTKILARFQEGKHLFEKAIGELGMEVASTTLQVTKTSFLKKDKDLTERVITQVQNYVSLLDELTVKGKRSTYEQKTT